MTRHSRRKCNGTSLLELPIGLWVFIFLMLFPLLDLVTLSYRAVIAYFCVRDACYKAALQHGCGAIYSTGTSTLTNDAGAYTGVNFGTVPVQIYIVDSPNGGGTPSKFALTGSNFLPASGSGSYNSNDLYLVEMDATASVSPLFVLGAPFTGVPGLTGPVSLNYQYHVVAEYPQGLSSL